MKIPLLHFALPVLLVPCFSYGQDFPQLLEAPGLSFLPESAVWRAGGAAVAHDGTDCVVCEAVPGNEGFLTTTIEGPGSLSFWWKINGTGPEDSMTLQAFPASGMALTPVNGTWPALSGNTKWKREELKLPPGPVKLKWKVTRGLLPVAMGVPGAFLDELTWTPQSTPLTVPVALDNPSLSVTVTGDGQARGLQDAQGGTYAVLSHTAILVTLPVMRVPVPAGFTYVRTTSGSIQGLAATRTKSFTSVVNGRAWLDNVFYFSAPGEVTVSMQSAGSAVVADLLLTGLTAEEVVDVAPGSWVASGYYWPVLDGDSEGGRFVKLEDVPFGYPGTNGALEKTVTASSRLRLKTRGSLTVSWNGAPVWSSSLLREWTPLDWSSPAGGGVIRLTGVADVDAIVLDAQPDVTVPAAMDSSPPISWTPGSGWGPVADALSYDGVDSLRLVPGAASGTARAQWSGMGTVAWRAREDFSPLANSTMRAVLDGAVVQSNLPPSRWRAGRAQVPAGAHTLDWSFTAVAGTPVYSAQLDAFGWEENVQPYSAAADSPLESWRSEGDEVWGVTTEDSQKGGSCLASPALARGGDSSVSLTVTGPATVAYLWRGRGDGVWRGTGPGNCRIAGAGGWREEVYDVTGTGPVTLSWRIADCETAVAAGSLLLDNLRVVPRSGPAAGFVALEPAVIVAAASGAMAISSLEGYTVDVLTGAESQDGVSSLRLPRGGTLRSEVTAPAEVRFWWKGEGTLHAGGFLNLSGGLATEWKQAVVALNGTGTRTFSWGASTTGLLLLDGITVSPVGAAGTFSAGAGNAAGVDWGVAHLGTDAAGSDPAVLFGGSPTARFGSDWSGLYWKSSDTTPRRLVWQARHDEPQLGGTMKAAPGVWQAGFQSAAAVSGNIQLTTAWTGSHRWIAGLAEALTAPTYGELLGAPEWTWSASDPAHWQASAASTLRGTQNGAWLSTEFTGEGWFIASAVTGRLLVDGVQYLSPGTVVLPLSAGTHTVRLEQNSAVAATITSPRFATQVPAQEGMDVATQPGVSVVSLPAGWTGISDRSYCPDGVDAALSPVLTSTPSVIRFSVTGPGWFRCRVTALGTGVSAAYRYVGEPFTMPLNEWIYASAGTWQMDLETRASVTTGARRLLVDQVEWQPETQIPAPAAGAAMETGAFTWSTRGALPFAAVASAQATNGSVASSPLLKTGDFTWMETTITGPGTLFLEASNFPGMAAPVMSVNTSATVQVLPLSAAERAFRFVDSGPSLVRFFFQHGDASQYGAGASAMARLDRMVWIPDSDPGLPLTSVVPGPGFTFGTPVSPAPPAAPGWRVFNPDGWGLILIAGGANPSTSVLPFTVSSPGFISGSVSGNGGLADHSGSVPYSSLQFLGGYLTPQRMSSSLLATSFAMVRNLSFQPSSPLSLEEALDTPGRTWTTGGAAPWFPVLRTDLIGDEVLSGAIPSGQSAWLETAVTPPAEIIWTGTPPGGGLLAVSAGGTVLSNLSTTAGTYRHVVTGSAPVAVRWTASISSTNPQLDRTASISSVTVKPGVTASLTEAADVSGLTLTTGSNAGVPWATDDEAPFQGSAALILSGTPVPPVPPNPVSWLSCAVNGPGVFSAAIQGTVGFTYTLDGTEVTPGWLPSPTSNWVQVWIVVESAGAHTIRLTTSASSIARADALRFDPLSGVSAANLPGLTFSADGPWVAFGPPGHRAIASRSPDNAETTLRAEITGPAAFQSTASGSSVSLSLNGTLFTHSGLLFLPAGTHLLTWKATYPMTLSEFALQAPDAMQTNVPALLGAPDLVIRTFSAAAVSSGTESPYMANEPYLVTGSFNAPSVFQPAGTRLHWAQATAPGKWCTETSTTTPTAREIPIGTNTGGVIHLAALESLPLPPVTIVEALEDISCLTWTAVRGWYPANTALSYDGVDSMVAAYSPEQPVMEATVTGPLSLEFSRSSHVDVFVNGVRILEGGGFTQPVEYRLDLGAGMHTLRWEAGLDGVISGETATLDRFRCLPAPVPALAAPVVAAIYARRTSRLTMERVVVTPPFLRNGNEFYPPSAPISQTPGTFRALEPRVLSEVIGVSSVSAGGWQGFGFPGTAGGVAWCLPPAGGACVMQFDITGDGILTVPSWLGLSGPSPGFGQSLVDGEPLFTAVRGASTAQHITISSWQEAAFTSAAWYPFAKERKFSAYSLGAGLAEQNALPDADPDADGRTNFYEFAFGGNPALADSPPSPPKPVVSARSGANFAALEYEGTTDGAYYRLQRLVAGEWISVASELEVLAETAPRRAVRLVYTGQPLPAPEAVILRVVAEAWPE